MGILTTPTDEPPTALRVLHVLPRDIARGAQVYARALADHANRSPGEQHELAVLFAGPPAAAMPEHELGVVSGRLHAAGLDPRAALRLRRLVRRTQPDVVVAHGAEAMKYAAFTGRRNCRVVCHCIGVVSAKARQGPSHAVQAAVLRRADLVTAVSQAVADELHDVFGLSADEIRVIPNGRDPAEFVGAGGPPADVAPQVIFVGHLTRTKRPEVFVKVIAGVRARGCAVTAAMVGDGPMRAELTEAAAAADVDLLGRRSDVPALLQSAAIFLFPSEAEGEGMPGVIIEAGMAGLPVVATDVPGVRDVIVDGETGRIVAVDDVEAMVDAVEVLLRNPAARSAMGYAARQRCAEVFSLEASTAAFVSELHKLAGAPISG